MKRIAVIGSIVAALTLSALPAWAHMTFLQASSRGFMNQAHTSATVLIRGTTDCDPGETIDTTAHLKQGTHLATLSFSDSNCPTGTENFVTTVTFNSAQPFHVGDARFSIQFLFSDGQDFHYNRVVRLIED